MTAHYKRPRNIPHYVYRCYDIDGRLIYIGCTNNPRSRFQLHESGSWWWQFVASQRCTVFPDREKALQVERDAIYDERPRCNVKGRWYFRDPRADWTALDYAEFHETVVRSASPVYGTNTSRMLETIEAEVKDRFGVVIPRSWRRSA